MEPQVDSYVKRPLRRCKHGKFPRRHRHHRHRPRSHSSHSRVPSNVASEKEMHRRERRRTRKQKKDWDSTMSNLDDYKLDEVKQVEKKLNRVSKHRHYAKELIRQQKRKFAEKKREEDEQKQLDLERRQLIQRQHGLLRGMPVTQGANQRVFAKFTQNKNLRDSDASATETDDPGDSYDSQRSRSMSDYDLYDPVQSGYNSEQEQNPTQQFSTLNGTSGTKLSVPDAGNQDLLQADLTDTSIGDLANQINTLEKQIASLELKQQQHALDRSHSQSRPQTSKTHTNSSLPPHLTMTSADDTAHTQHTQHTLNTKTSQQLQDTQKSQKTPTKTLLGTNVRITKSPVKNVHLDAESLPQTLSKIRDCLHDIEAQRQNYESFKNTILELINAQNSQILKLVSSMASQQSQLNNLQQAVEKLDRTTIHINPDVSDPTWHATKEPQVTITSHQHQQQTQPTVTNVSENSRHPTQSESNPKSTHTMPVPTKLKQSSSSRASRSANKASEKQSKRVSEPLGTDAINSKSVIIDDKNHHIQKFSTVTTPDVAIGARGSRSSGEPTVSAMLLDQSTDWKSIAAMIPSNFDRTQVVEKKEYPSMRVYLPQDAYFPGKGFDHVKRVVTASESSAGNAGHAANVVKDRENSVKVIRSFLPPKNTETFRNTMDAYSQVLPNETLPRPVPKMTEKGGSSLDYSNTSSMEKLINGDVKVKKFGSMNQSWTMNSNDTPKIRVERVNHMRPSGRSY